VRMPESAAWLEKRRRRLAVESTPLQRGDERQTPSPVGACRPALVASLLGMANQLTGAYPILIYAPLIAATGGSTACPGVSGGTVPPSSAALPLIVCFANLAGAVIAVPLLARLRRRILVLSGLALVSACLFVAAHLERSAASREEMGGALSAALVLWCIGYEVGPGAGYFVVAGELATPPWGTVTFATGNSVRFACEFASSFLFLSSCARWGTSFMLGFHGVVAAALALVLFVVLPETRAETAAPHAVGMH